MAQMQKSVLFTNELLDERGIVILSSAKNPSFNPQTNGLPRRYAPRNDQLHNRGWDGPYKYFFPRIIAEVT